MFPDFGGPAVGLFREVYLLSTGKRSVFFLLHLALNLYLAMIGLGLTLVG